MSTSESNRADEFTCFADESYQTASRFRSIGSVSLPSEALEQVEDELKRLFVDSEFRDFKWEKVKDNRSRITALQLIDCVLQRHLPLGLRIDVLVWDTHDGRHRLRGRNDIQNFERMFYHLQRSSMRKRPRGSRWKIFPDERLGIDWATIDQCLYHSGRRREYECTLFGDFLSDPDFKVVEFQEVKSHDKVLVQAADFFSGMAAFSRIEFDKYRAWFRSQSAQMSMFPFDSPELSRRESARFEVIRCFKEACDARKLGISLESSTGLRTRLPTNPISIWLYDPQGDYDKAPQK